MFFNQACNHFCIQNIWQQKTLTGIGVAMESNIQLLLRNHIIRQWIRIRLITPQSGSWLFIFLHCIYFNIFFVPCNKYNIYILKIKEFPQDNDTCYMAHCYPYTYSDLQRDLTSMMKKGGNLLKLDSLCVTRAGNTCFLVTIDDPG